VGSVQEVSHEIKLRNRLNLARSQIKYLSNQLSSAQEDVRKRIALELHDGISQNLSAIKLKIEQYLFAMTKGKTNEYSLGQSVVLNIQNTIEEIRRISMDLHPSILDDLGLLQTIDWLCKEFRATHSRMDIRKKFSIREENVPEALKITIFRIIQESLNNVLKHANATETSVEIDNPCNGIRLCVADNGVGFTSGCNSNSAFNTGLGLKSMQERAKSTGGVFEIDSAVGEGAKVRVFWSRQKVDELCG
jgi:signal transduction histidine kinase